MKRVFRITVAAALGLVALLAFAACGEKEVATPEVSIKAADYSFALPDSVAGGITRIRLDNTGKESHHAAFARLNDGVTFQQFQGTLQSALQAIPTEGEAAFGGFSVSSPLRVGHLQLGLEASPRWCRTSSLANMQWSALSPALMAFLTSPRGWSSRLR
ncbi:MAG: hypothetical protein HYY31_01405 [Chloroflexi bacterium]|nr:hypothetical protein [Chloroflexota bacterium]